VGTRYGNAQVRVTVRDGRIAGIEALQLQSDDQRSVQISSSAEPILRQEALTAQSAPGDAAGPVGPDGRSPRGVIAVCPRVDSLPPRV
jgi:uncharacterized protein with FMN-binding domain